MNFSKQSNPALFGQKVALPEQLLNIQELLPSEPLKALDLAHQVLIQALHNPDSDLLARTHLLIGRAALQTKQFELATKSFTETIEIGQVGTRAVLEANLYLGRTYRETGETPKSIETLGFTIKEAQAYGHLDVAADAMNSLSNLLFVQGNYGAALTTLNDAASLAKRTNQPLQEAKFLNNSAQILMQLGDHQGALQYLQEAQTKLKNVPQQDLNETSYLLSLGNLYQRMNETQNAKQCFLEALRFAEQHQDQKGISAAHNNLGNVLLEQQEFIEAKEHFEIALKLARELGNIGFEVNNLDGLGELHRSLGSHQEALLMHRSALHLSRTIQDANSAMDALLNLGRDHLALGNHQEALMLLQETLHLAKDAQRQKTIFESHQWLSETYQQQSDYRLALEHYQQFHEVRKLVFQEEHKQQSVLLHAQFALEHSRLERKLTQAAWQDTQTQIAARTANLELTQEELFLAFAKTLEFLNVSGEDYTYRIGEYSTRIAIALGWTTEQANQLKLAAQLHNLGKIGIHNKQNLGVQQELESHPMIAASILEGMHSPLLCLISEMAISHHEQWDGTGYPHQLSGKAIPIAARIVAIAIRYDQLTQGETAKSIKEALLEIEQQSGTKFDPSIVKKALEVLR
jgi:response regulator RpfG family c-di-GMP phosphodiesterase